MRMVDRVATASRVPAILADAGGRQWATRCADRQRTSVEARPVRAPRTDASGAARIRHEKRPPRRAAVRCGETGLTRYSAMSADAFAGRAGAVPVAFDGAVRSIFGGGESCSTSLV